MAKNSIKIESVLVASKFPISGRKLHRFLMYKSDFITWIEGLVKKYSFVCDIDFKVTGYYCSDDNNKTIFVTDYLLSFEMARFISRLKSIWEGWVARGFFIKKEVEQRECIENNKYQRLISELKNDEKEHSPWD